LEIAPIKKDELYGISIFFKCFVASINCDKSGDAQVKYFSHASSKVHSNSNLCINSAHLSGLVISLRTLSTLLQYLIIIETEGLETSEVAITYFQFAINR
jgi:hypothetical protein